MTDGLKLIYLSFAVACVAFLMYILYMNITSVYCVFIYKRD